MTEGDRNRGEERKDLREEVKQRGNWRDTIGGNNKLTLLHTLKHSHVEVGEVNIMLLNESCDFSHRGHEKNRLL